MPPKPRITKPRLEWKLIGGKWCPRHRITYTVAGKRRERTIALDWQGDPQRLDRLYWECEAGKHARQQPPPSRYSWRALIEAWRSDPRIQRCIADSTKRKYRPVMDRILEKNGDKDVRKTTRPAIRAAHDSLAETPRKADWYVQVVSLLWNYGAKKLDWPLGPNPASGIDLFGKQREYEAWPAWMVAKLDTAPETVRTAAELILGTGQRPNAAIRMMWSQFQGEWMTVTDEKGGNAFEVYCPRQLREYLSTARRSGAYVLAKNLRQPLGYDAVEKQFRAWREDLGTKARGYVLHGLRKLAIVRLAEAGCTDAEIQAVTGQSMEMVAFYRAKASRKALSKSAMERKKHES